MSMKKQNVNQSNVSLSKPSGTRTVLSPRARGKRASNKMGDLDKEKDIEKVAEEKKEPVKDDFDRESVPLSDKEVYMAKKDIFKSDSTLSNTNLVVTTIPNVVPNECGDVSGTNQDGDANNAPDGEQGRSDDSKDVNEKCVSEIDIPSEQTSLKIADDGGKYVKPVGNIQEDNNVSGTKTTNSIKESTASITSKDNKSETVRSSTSCKEIKDETVKSSSISVNSIESKSTLSKGSGSIYSKESKGNSAKGSTLSVNSKETKAESRPSSMKKKNNTSTQLNSTSSEAEIGIQSTQNDVKKGLPGSTTETVNGVINTKVYTIDAKSNGTPLISPSDITGSNVNSTEVVSLTVPGKTVDGVEKQTPNVEARKDSIVADSLRRESTKFSFGSRKSVDIRVQYTAVQMPTTEDKTKASVYATDDSWIRIAIPYMPVGVAVLCLCLNICVPGLGTMISGFSIFCCGVSRVPSKYDQDAIVILCVNFWVGVAQLFTVSFMLVGWFWSLAWGVKMVILAVERRQELKDRRAKELQTLALKAFGSSIPAAHLTTMS